MTEERNLRKCKVCEKLQNRIQNGTYDGYHKRWVDDSGAPWNGKVCPTCQRVQARSMMQKLRETRRAK